MTQEERKKVIRRIADYIEALWDFFTEPAMRVWSIIAVLGGGIMFVEYLYPQVVNDYLINGAWLCFVVFVLSIVAKILYIVNTYREQQKKLIENIGKLNEQFTIENSKQQQVIMENFIALNDKFANQSVSSCIPTKEKEERCHQIIINKLDERSHFQYYTSDVTEELKKKLSVNARITKLKIICYGRKGYDEVLEHISRLNREIDVEVIMYNTEMGAEFQREDDRRDIDKQIEVLKSWRQDVTVYVSDIPPMIRASALYQEDTAVWTTIQTYQFQYENVKKEEQGKSNTTERLDLYRPQKSLAIICDETSSKKDFDGVTEYFNSEFERLKKRSKEAVLYKNKVIYQVRLDET